MSKRISKNKASSCTPGICPTRERRQQNGGVVEERIHQRNADKIYTRRHRAAFECALDAYLWHGVITEPEFDAGMKFYREYARSVLKIKIYDPGTGSRGDIEMPTISAINGNAVLREAFDLLSTMQREVLILVCVNNTRAGNTFRKNILSQALRILAKHWNML